MEQIQTIRSHLERRLDSLRGLADQERVRHSTLQSVLRDGVEMGSPANRWSQVEGRLIELVSRSIQFRRGQCFGNAQRAALLAAELGAASAGHTVAYCEGYAYLPMPAPFSHGWCLLNGRVWDPTLEHLRIPARYLGIPIPLSFVHAVASERGRFGPILHRWQEHHRRGNPPATVERTRRVGSPVGQGGGLAGAGARL
jgi:hypothetical protein